MSVSSHLDQLRRKHDMLEEKVREEEKRPGSDHVAVTALKREKLLLKEEIERLSQTAPTP